MNGLELFEGLNDTARKHEKDIVVEFCPDRLLHFLGVYFIVLLALVAKFDEVTGPKASCYAASNESKYGKTFTNYANVYCWESLDITAPYNASFTNHTYCAGINRAELSKGRNVVRDAVFVKSFIQWLPYGMLVEAFLLALPSAWWHFRVGARLMGHLKFVKLLLQDIYADVKDLPAGIYKSDEQSGLSLRVPSGEKCAYRWRWWRRKKSRSNEGVSAAENGAVGKNSKANYLKSDREMFSSLCDENISSFVHQPYVASVFRLTSSRALRHLQNADQPQPLKNAVLTHLCHEKNFTGNIIARSYEKKCLIGIAVSFVALVGLTVVTYVIGENGWISGTFLCDVIYHEKACLLCTIPRMTESLGFLIVNLVVTATYLAVTIWRLLTFSDDGSPIGDEFLRSLGDTNSIALLAAYKKKKAE